MTTTDLKPGDIVQHPEHGYGVVLKNFPGVPTIYFAGKHGYENTTRGFTGWERAETCTPEAVRILEDYQQIVSKSAGVIVRDAVVMMTPTAYEAYRGRETVRPGHVQVRVDDLGEDGEDLSDWLNADEDSWELSGRLAIRVAKAIAAQRGESTPTADEQEADFAIGWLNCPWCSESFTIAPRLARDAGGHVRNVGLSIVHTCPPVQPDEPTEFGARITVTRPDGTREKWCRLGQNHPAPWLGEAYGVPGEDWRLLCGRGTVTIGWDE